MNLLPRIGPGTETCLEVPKVRMFASACALGIAALTASVAPNVASAHEAQAGAVTIEHPYAVPTPPGARTGGMYFRRLKNGGASLDRLTAASTPIARTIEFHRMQMDGDVMKMRAQPAIDLPPGKELEVRHGGTLHLMLLDLKQPLKDGDRFPVTLTFERGGKQEVMVWVQQPRAAATAVGHDAHKH